MTLEVRLRPEARDELREAWIWYEDRRPGLGDDFLICVEAAFAAAARSPELDPCVEEDVRRAMVRRFPYAVLFRQRGQSIEVLAVFHGSRDPGLWRERVSGPLVPERDEE